MDERLPNLGLCLKLWDQISHSPACSAEKVFLFGAPTSGGGGGAGVNSQMQAWVLCVRPVQNTGDLPGGGTRSLAEREGVLPEKAIQRT